LSQARLASLTGTSQATISAYENGSKQPSVATFSRLLAATGTRLAVEHMAAPVVEPSAAELERASHTLAEVIALAEALPVEHEPTLRFPRLAA
jgi:transcriptional regulator with XRE-family HTH domain